MTSNLFSEQHQRHTTILNFLNINFFKGSFLWILPSKETAIYFKIVDLKLKELCKISSGFAQFQGNFKPTTEEQYVGFFQHLT